MKNVIANNRAEGHIDTGVKIIIAVVIGALILGGLYLLFAGEGGVMDKLDGEVGDMMDYTQELRYERYYNEESNTYIIRYSYDGKHWNDADVPTVSGTATIYGVMSNRSEENSIEVALIQDGTTYHVITSTDGGITWTSKLTFTGKGIDKFYFRDDGKFVIRVWRGGQTYFTMTSYGETWVMPEWSDIIRPN